MLKLRSVGAGGAEGIREFLPVTLPPSRVFMTCEMETRGQLAEGGPISYVNHSVCAYLIVEDLSHSVGQGDALGIRRETGQIGYGDSSRQCKISFLANDRWGMAAGCVKWSDMPWRVELEE